MSSGDETLTTQEDSADDGGSEVAVRRKLAMEVSVEKSGPCRRHVKVTIPRSEIDATFSEAVGELKETAAVPGFRVGHVPKGLIEKRFRKELQGHLKQKLLIDSLEQLAEEQSLEPINQPDIDVDAVEIPDEGDFTYEFDVEVRPEFDLPDYSGLEIQRPVMNLRDEDVDAYIEGFLAEKGSLETLEGPAALNDIVAVKMEFSHDGKPLHSVSRQLICVRPTLRFRDAELEGFDRLMVGAQAGDTRQADVQVTSEAETIEMRGETVHLELTVLTVYRRILPELTSEFLAELGVESKEELTQSARNVLQRQNVYRQRQAVREQVLEKITESADWELPEELVMKQVENALRRQVLEMQQAGFTIADIQARENQLRQRATSTTTQGLKEHFVLDKIATTENIVTYNSDIDAEISAMAFQQGESARKLRARLVKSGVMENLEAQIRERKAVDFILSRAKFVDYEVEQPSPTAVTAITTSVCRTTPTASGNVAEDEAAGE